jgi:dolichol-phosphate mannosyltransferase
MVPQNTLDFIVPVFNEAECIDELMRRLLALRGRATDLQISATFINDGSVDNSLNKLTTYAHQYSFVRVINLSRNFGHQIAVTAGIDAAITDYVCIIDADLQDPPELVLDMYREMQRLGANVIYAKRRQRAGDSAFKRASAAIFYRILGRLCKVDIPSDTGDFRLIDQKVILALKKIREHKRFLRGLIPWIGFKSAPFLYDREARFAGYTKYPLRKMIGLAFDAILAFSSQPLRLASFVGLAIVIVGLLLLFYILILKFFSDQVVPGLTVLLMTVIILGGFQILMFGLVGEYIGRIFEEVRNRPLYLIDSLINIHSDSGKKNSMDR